MQAKAIFKMQAQVVKCKLGTRMHPKAKFTAKPK